MDNLDRIEEIYQCVGRLWCEVDINQDGIRDDLHTILDNIQFIKAELLDLLHQLNTLQSSDLIDRDALKQKIYKDFDRCHNIYEFTSCILLRIEAAPEIKPDGGEEDDQKT